MISLLKALKNYNYFVICSINRVNEILNLQLIIYQYYCNKDTINEILIIQE